MADYSELTRQLINKLVQACDKPDGVKCVDVNITLKRFSGYHQAPTSDRLATHKELELLAARSREALVIGYINQGFDAVPILEKLQIVHGDNFLKTIGITSQINHLKESAQKAKCLLGTAPDWLRTALIELPEQWMAGRTYKDIAAKHLEKLELAVKLASWIETSGVEACDYRTASVHALGQSKQLEKNLRWLAKIFTLKNPEHLSGLSDHDILAAFGLSRWGAELKMRGDCRIHYPQGDMHITFAKPYVSLDITEITNIHCESTPRYVLMIENLTTFKRYSKEINDDSLIIYTGGFPSTGWVRLIKPLVASLAPEVPVFHWGDIDIGGYRILAFLTHALEQDVIPYCMNDVTAPVTGETLPINKLQQALGENLSGHLLTLSQSLEALKKMDKVLETVEQESIAVKAPPLNTGGD